MPKTLILTLCLLAISPVARPAVSAGTTPTKADEKAAAVETSNEADRWAAHEAAAPAPAATATPPPPPAAPAPEPVKPPKPTEVKTPTDPAMRYNEMIGTVNDVDMDARVLRLALEGGYNVQFSYDSKTQMTNGGKPIVIDDLGYGDKVQIRYAGKELYAVQIERLETAPRTLDQ